jgi:predicted Rossmann fold nucleotide-binding protein DprA/Smf involved in DNA uptake
MPEVVRNRREVFRDSFRMQDRIVALLREAPQTIPSLASALGMPADEVMLWVMAMWRYGQVAPAGKADAEGYYQYRLSV